MSPRNRATQASSYSGVDSVYAQYGLSNNSAEDVEPVPPLPSGLRPHSGSADSIYPSQTPSRPPTYTSTTSNRQSTLTVDLVVDDLESSSTSLSPSLRTSTNASRHRHHHVPNDSVVSLTPTLAETHNPFYDNAAAASCTASATSYLPRFPFQRNSHSASRDRQPSEGGPGDGAFLSTTNLLADNNNNNSSQVTLVPSQNPSTVDLKLAIGGNTDSLKPFNLALTDPTKSEHDPANPFSSYHETKPLPLPPPTPAPRRALRRVGVCWGLCCFGTLFIMSACAVSFMMLMINSNLDTWSHRVEQLPYGIGNPHERVRWDREREEWERRKGLEGSNGVLDGI